METRSQVIVHWTGRQIDKLACHPMTHDVRCQYIDLLKSIYEYGLLFNPQAADTIVGVGDQALELPNLPNVCFTELLPEFWPLFAMRYGKLGIGLDRGYLLSRGANPVLYVQNASEGIVNTNLVTLGNALKMMASGAYPITFSYLKPMSSNAGGTTLDYYEEHEWRIVKPGPLWVSTGERLPLPPEFTEVVTNQGVRPTF